MDLEAEVKADMESLGCTSKSKIALAYHLYIYLIDAKLMYDVEYCYNKDIDTLYVIAKPSKNHKSNIYVPFSTSEDVTVDSVERFQENLCTIETGPVVNLAFIDGDSTTVIYNFTKGLLDIQSPDGLAGRHTRGERRSYINSELRKKRDQIIQDTIDGGAMEDEDCPVVG